MREDKAFCVRCKNLVGRFCIETNLTPLHLKASHHYHLAFRNDQAYCRLIVPDKQELPECAFVS